MPVTFTDTVVGTGAEAVARATLVVDYVGTYTDATTGAVVTFDQSYPRPAPFSFQLGLGQVIAGWDQGLLGMKVGGERQLVISADLAYGATGQGSIPPNTDLNFTVRLHAVETFPAAAYFGLTTTQARSVFSWLYGSRVPSQGVEPFADLIAPDPAVTNYWIQSFGGNDLVRGGVYSDVIFAGEDNDSIYGDGGNDALIGGGGDDFIDGGEGADVAVYHGLFADYQFAVVPVEVGQPVQFTVADLVAGRDGLDQLNAVERLMFSDRYVTAAIVDGAVQIQDYVIPTPQPAPQPAPQSAPSPSATPVAASPAPAAQVSQVPAPDPVDARVASTSSETGGDYLIAPLENARPGAGMIECTEGGDRILFAGDGAGFGKRERDKLVAFDPSEDRIILERADFRGHKALSLVVVEGRKEQKYAAFTGAALVYRSDNGDLSWNQNAERRGWGRQGGSFARLDPGLNLDLSNFSLG